MFPLTRGIASDSNCRSSNCQFHRFHKESNEGDKRTLRREDSVHTRVHILSQLSYDSTTYYVEPPSTLLLQKGQRILWEILRVESLRTDVGVHSGVRILHWQLSYDSTMYYVITPSASLARIKYTSNFFEWYCWGSTNITLVLNQSDYFLTC